MNQEVAIVAGLTQERVIGNGNELPWQRIKDDLPNFKRLTSGHVVIMGLNTYLSLNRPLPNRHNIVISREPVDIPGVEVVTSIEAAIEQGKTYGTKIFIIGGASIYEQTLPQVNMMYLSFIKQPYAGDKFFPAYNEKDWERVAEQEFDEFTFVTLSRRQS